MLMFLKVTLHVQTLPQKHVYQVFQWMMHLAKIRMLYVLYSFLRFGLHVALQN